MSLISSLIISNLIKAVEEEFLKHEPEMQDKIIEEMQNLISEAMSWVRGKLEGKNAVS